MQLKFISLLNIGYRLYAPYLGNTYAILDNPERAMFTTISLCVIVVGTLYLLYLLYI